MGESLLGRVRRTIVGSSPAVPGGNQHPRRPRRVRELELRVEELERDLRERVAEVEEGLQEQRGLSQRVAELGDLVAEVIGAAVRGEKAEFEAALAKYSDGI